MKLIIGCLLVLTFQSARAQQLYMKAFGKPSDPAVIFLHGGPGYNAALFEGTTAQSLSEKGLFVIVYDRRGEGRSTDPAAKFTFKETLDDIDSIYEHYNLSRASLIGHSFGGIVGIQYATAHAAKVSSLILVGAPVELQASFLHIIQRSQEMFEERKDSAGLKRLSYVRKMDPASLMYSSTCFQLAMQNGSYSPRKRSEEAEKISAAFRKDSVLADLARKMTMPPVNGFWKNEQYTTLDLSSTLEMFKATNIRVYGLYGKEDGLYADAQIQKLKKLIGENQVLYLDDCSHNVFVDQQEIFIRQVTQWCR